MKLKNLVVGFSVLVLGLGLSGCSTKQASTDTSLSDVKKAGKLVVVTESEFAPFEFKTLVDGKDTLVGADIELAKAIGDKLGVEVEFSVLSFDNVLASLQAGKADIAIAGISVTDERKQVFDFSDTYYQSKNTVLVQKADLEKYTDSSSLSGLTVGVQKGSVQETVAKDQLAGASIVSLTGTSEMINELKSGQLNAVVLEEPIAQGYIDNNAELVFATFSLDSSESDAYAIALPKGSDALKAEINEVIAELTSSGQYDQFVTDAYQLSVSK
ncbi:transporter substrate-binding domain-containing protein [Streptococcus caprae]|uniref:Transporter substrate-binding domain-containing protein n=1 Tax=Streptococcus caprae TaxID=1640501 RepID=A0ABV8CV57_9STRE